MVNRMQQSMTKLNPMANKRMIADIKFFLLKV